MLAVASSNIKIAGLRAIILANANSCFCPAEYELPLSFAISSIPFGNVSTNSFAEQSSKTSFISSSNNTSFN